MVQPEQQAREEIDRLLQAAGWHVCDAAQANIHAAKGVAIREFPLPGYGFADYLLYVDGKAAGVIEAKKEGVTLTGVETQAEKYTKGLPAGLPRWGNPLPFSYQSTGVETRFTHGLDPQPRSRPVFAFHTPQLLSDWLRLEGSTPSGPNLAASPSPTFLSRLQSMPPLADKLWPPKPKAIENIERSLRENRPRALVQMATGSGKTLLAIVLAYRLLKFAGARRILFLVDRGNLADQTLKEFQQYASPYNNFKFTEEYIVQRLQGNTLDTTARVCICTIQRMYSMLKGRDLPEDLDEESVEQLGSLFRQPEPIDYNPAIPIESFDIIVTDECHRSIYNLWAQVLEYFDAYLIGLTATPSKQTFGFFNQNLVMEYNHEMAVADGVNVNYDVYRIRTAITEQGSHVEAGYSVQIQERDTRKKRWEQLDDDFSYDPNQLDRDVVAPDQIRKIIQTYRDKLFTEIFPGREWVPKTLIFAKDDAHAENIVEIVREEFGKGNDFAQKITYRTTGAKPKDLINEFRTSPMPRIAVTVDMIATGTDIKAVEVIMFMRAVKSRAFFEQMKGRGVRVIKPDDLQSVTPDARAKDHFVIVDAVGVCEQDKTDSNPAPQGDEYFANGKYPFVRVQDMGRLSGATKINATNDYVNDKALKGLHLFPKGSVLFTKSGASTLLNQRAMLGSDMYVVSHIAVAIPRGGILSEWLYYWLRTVDFAHLAHATTLPSLPLSKAKTIPIPIAPLDQQERIIAEIEKQFSRLDEAVANLKRVKANLKRYKATVLKAAVEGRLVETEAELARREGRSYETGEQLLQRILETRRSQWKGKGKYKEPAAPDTTDLPELPEGWVWATWDQISNWVTYGFTRPMPHVEDGVPIVTAKHVIDGRIVLDDTHKTPYQDYVELSAKDRPEPGDILITKDGTIGRAAVVPQHEGFCINQSVAVVWLRSCPIHRQYLLAIIESELVQKPVREKARGVAIKHLSITDFAMLPLPIAPLEEQTRIVAEVDHRLSILRAAEAAIKANLQRSGGLKQATLAAAFGPTGTRRGSLNAN